MQTAYVGSLVTILILHEISILIICTPPLLELSGQLLPLLRGDEIFSFGFQVGEHLLVLPHVNLTHGRLEMFRFLNVVMFVIKKGLSGVGDTPLDCYDCSANMKKQQNIFLCSEKVQCTGNCINK